MANSFLRIPRPMLLSCLLLLSNSTFSQSGIGGQAPVSLVEGSPDCNGFCATVEVYIDMTGLMGTSAPAGLNAFVLAFDLNRSQVFASARAGTSPLLDWFFLPTNRALVDASNRLVLVGSVADPAAPNQNYHVATLVFCGTAGNVTLSFLASESSLGSKWIGGDGPSPIAIQPPGLFQTSILVNFPLLWGQGISSWRLNNPNYDLADPIGDVDVSDLVKLVNCGKP